MKDTLRQPDGKIRTACKFCRQRKKKCSGEMPCASCVNFNRDCCVYDRWVSSPSSARPKETASVNRHFAWADPNNSTTQPTSPCFTSKVLLTKVQSSHQQCCTPQSQSLLLQAPFIPQASSSHYSPDDHSVLSNSTPWSPFDSPLSLQSTPLTPAETMMRTVSLPSFLDRTWTQDDSPVIEQFNPLPTMDGWTQASSPSSQASPLSPSETQSGNLSPTAFSTPTTEPQSYRQLLYQGEKETQELLQNVDALLMHLGSA